MGKKPFVDKRKAATFSLVFRGGHGGEGAPEERIFVRTDGGTNHVPGFSDDYPQRGEGGGDVFGDAEDEEEEEGEEEVDGFGEGGERARRRAPDSMSRLSADAWSVSGGKKVLSEDARREILEMGLPDDGYDYTKHLREIGIKRSFGVFVPSETRVGALRADVKAYDASMVELRSAPEDLENITDMKVITAVSSQTRELRVAGDTFKGIDPDILAALDNSEGSEEGSGDELEDDFVVQANAYSGMGGEGSGKTFERDEKLGGQDGRGESEGEAGIGRGKGKLQMDRRGQLLREHAERDKLVAGKIGMRSEAGEESDEWEEFDDEDDSDEDQGAEERRQMSLKDGASARRLRLLDEQFENLAMREYDDDEIGEMDEGDPLARGHADISHFDSVLDEFLEQSKEHTLEEARGLLGRRERKPSTDAKGTKEEGERSSADGVHAEKATSSGGDEQQIACEDGRDGSLEGKDIGEDSQSKREVGGREERVEDHEVSEEEEELVLTETEEDEREMWDCESIVSTYSNLDNHPAKIGDPGKKRSERKPLQKLPEGVPVDKIRLTGREQLPVDFLPRRVGGQGEAKVAVADGSPEILARRKDETPEERKARKTAAKEQQRKARAVKKEVRMMYRRVGVQAQQGAARITPQGMHLQ